MTAVIPATTETIIWDLDGTLLDSFAVYRDALAEILPLYGRRVPGEGELLANFHGSLQESISGVLGEVNQEELLKIINSFLEVQNKHYEIIGHHLYADALALVRKAAVSQIRQIIVTNREHAGRQLASPRSIVERSSLKQYISAIVCGDDGEHRKPRPEVLGGLAATINPVKTVVIGDQHVDAAFALNLGSSAVIVDRGGSNRSLAEYANVDRIRIIQTLEAVQIV